MFLLRCVNEIRESKTNTYNTKTKQYNYNIRQDSCSVYMYMYSDHCNNLQLPLPLLGGKIHSHTFPQSTCLLPFASKHVGNQPPSLQSHQASVMIWLLILLLANVLGHTSLDYLPQKTENINLYPLHVLHEYCINISYVIRYLD